MVENLITPTLEKDKNNNLNLRRVISEETSRKIKKILRKVVTDEKGTASLADIYGYKVSGKTGTSQYYDNENKNINTFISFFIISNKNYVLLVMLMIPRLLKILFIIIEVLKLKALEMKQVGMLYIHRAKL